MRIVASILLVASTLVPADLFAQGRGRTAGASPASQRPPQTVTPQTYPADQVATGRRLFAARCGSCHGPEATGEAGDTDLTRSTLVSQDVRGDKIGPLVRTGRSDKGMPPIAVSDEDLAAIVAFVHDRHTAAETLLGGRRSVDVADLQTGNADAGRKYFDAACTRCHSATGDLSGISSRLQGLALLQRMLYPGSGGGGAVKPPTVTVTAPNGQTVTGTLAYRDEFTIALTDSAGSYRSWPTRRVTFKVDDKLSAHVEQLAKYTDDDMHDVFAYLQSLK
ncbi:MAG TPA: c-type cytochrome [Vicinamibacterales bacterium]|nr:c-type cytochrome [Vicinamibacterales bacterium]